MNSVEYQRMYEVEDSHWWYVGLHELILASVRTESLRLGRPLRIFDAGCGTGRLCQMLAAQGHEVSGCDASGEALLLCRQRGVNDVCHADLNTLELEPKRFDIITSVDVLYHTGITDDVAVMRRLRRGLTQGGMLILNLVAYEFLRSSHDIAVHTRERYTKNILIRRLQEAGYDVNFAGYRVCPVFPFIALYRLLSRGNCRSHHESGSVASDVAPPHPLVNQLLLKMIRLENALLPSLSMPFGSSIYAQARNRDE